MLCALCFCALCFVLCVLCAAVCVVRCCVLCALCFMLCAVCAAVLLYLLLCAAAVLCNPALCDVYSVCCVCCVCCMYCAGCFVLYVLSVLRVLCVLCALCAALCSDYCTNYGLLRTVLCSVYQKTDSDYSWCNKHRSCGGSCSNDSRVSSRHTSATGSTPPLQAQASDCLTTRIAS
jgi:hypothetical protein